MSEVPCRQRRGVVCECSTWNRTFGLGGHGEAPAWATARACSPVLVASHGSPVLDHATRALVAYIFERCCLLRPGPLFPYADLPAPARRGTSAR
jgi:hypothetical protein